MDNKEIPQVDIYSDGGAEPNPGKGGFGVIMSYKGIKKEFSKGYLLTTNNRMELMGVIFGLEALKKQSIVTIYTDSRYVIDGITKGWAEKWKSKNWYRSQNNKAINHDLWERLLMVISHHIEVKFFWVKGHAGHNENERCDKLAELALNGTDLSEDTGYVPKVESDNYMEEPAISAGSPKNKIRNEGDLCRKCGTRVVKRTPKKVDKPKQTYYFEYYFICPACKTTYMVEEAKRFINKQENNHNLFD